MATTRQHPSRRYTVGSQYICFNTMSADGEWTQNFEEAVTELPTVVDVEIGDNSDAYDVYASGNIYESDTPVTSQEISETNVAFPESLLARMRGETVEDGVVLGGGYGTRPFFAYGVEINYKDGTKDLRWYPKCKLTENDDRAETSEDKNKDQNRGITIKAYGFNENGNTVVKSLTDDEAMANMTPALFFAKPLLDVASVKALLNT